MTLVGLNSKSLKKGDPEPPLAPGKLRIYNMRFCPWAQRTIIYAALKKLPVEIVNIGIKNKPEWFVKKHWKAQVPTLEHDGKIINESSVIPEYLDDIYPGNRILPSDPYEKVQQKNLVARLSELTTSFVTIAYANDSNKHEKVADLKKSLKTAEHLLPGSYYSGTSKPGFADYLFYPNLQKLYWLSTMRPDLPLDPNNFPGNEKYPKLTSWYSKISAIPEVIAQTI